MTDKATEAAERFVITRVLDAPRELVWKAWTTPEYFKQWWGPRGFTTPVCKVDFRVGGKFLYCMRSPDGQDFWNGGEYHEIVPLERIVFSMYFADAEGNRVEPEQLGVSHEVIQDASDEVRFEDLGNGQTRLTFIGNETMKTAVESGQFEGMQQILDKFVETLASLAQTR